MLLRRAASTQFVAISIKRTVVSESECAMALDLLLEQTGMPPLSELTEDTKEMPHYMVPPYIRNGKASHTNRLALADTPVFFASTDACQQQEAATAPSLAAQVTL